MEQVVIHAVYLINCASKEPEIRKKSIASLTHALRVGDGIGADGVVLHAGSRKGEPHAASMKRAAQGNRQGARRHRDAARSCSRTPPAPTARLAATSTSSPGSLDLLDGDARVGICLDSCHLLASGFEIRTPEALDAVLEEFDAKVGLDRLRCLHLNDSKIPLGGNRDRHAPLGEGEIGKDGLAVFLSEPRFEKLPTLIETGRDGQVGTAGRQAGEKAA